MKIKLVYKGGAGSGNHGHSGRPGKVGGSSRGLSTYSTTSEALRQYSDAKDGSSMQLIMAPNGDVGVSSDGSGGHTFIANEMIKSKKYQHNLLTANNRGFAAEDYLILNGFVRMVYQPKERVLNIELNNFTKSTYRMLRESLSSDDPISAVWIDSYIPYGTGRNIPFADFMAASSITFRNGDIELKEK